MNSEITIGNKLSIGIDTNIIGAGIGCIVNLDTRIFGLTLFCFFILVKIPVTYGKVYTFKMTDYKLAKVNGKNYFCKPHETFIPKVIYIRSRNSGEVHEQKKFALVDNVHFRGAISTVESGHSLPYHGKPAFHVFYTSDEYYYFKPNQMVRGFIKNEEITILSIVD